MKPNTKANKSKSSSQSKNVKQLIHEEEKDLRKESYSNLKKAQKDLLDKHTDAYNQMVADPRGADPVRSITTRGGYPGLTGIAKTKCKFTMTVGTLGFGYCMFDPQSCGPRTSYSVGWYTNAAYGGSGSSVPVVNGAGVTIISWAQAPFTNQAYDPLQLQARCIAAALYVTPSSSVTNQSGTLRLLEIPGHYVGTTGFTIDTIGNHPRTRKIRAAQLGDPQILNVLNWHPQASAISGANNSVLSSPIDDAVFRSYPARTLDTVDSVSLIATIEGSAGNTYDCEFWAVYEMRGSLVNSQQPTFSNPMGEAILWNAYAHKNISGWNATAAEASKAYAAAATHSANQVEPGGGHPYLKQGLEAGKMVMELAREVGGFFGTFA